MVRLYSIKDKVAVVTGGAQSLGLCIARQLAQMGAKVVIGDIRSSGADAVVEINKEFGPNTAVFQQCDVTDSSALHALIDLATIRFGQLDILVNNAGILDKPWNLDPSGETALACININFSALVDGTNYALHLWNQVEGSRGVVINIGSIAAYCPMEYLATYTATKAAVAAYTKSLSGLAPKVRVNAVAPSWIETKLLEAEHIGRNHFTIKKYGLLQPQQVVDQVVRLIEDESFAGDIIIIRNGDEPKLCKLPNATDMMAIITSEDN
ncbi:hypothetical protein IWW36_000931 [Coemansia brasiliensis]|uniref:Uncharacterized protein n=1 Tax=Coemansia brasiliensis TaxID=2650707 RepID=A0A9W8ICG5_9FUNG|nr:hypothetical protein IWW36_000931 [Coemansia brasiliensis]